MAARPPRASRWLSLFTVSFMHEYYNDRGGRCPALRVRPTPQSAALMASLGILFRDLGAGFALVADEAKAGALAGYVAGRSDGWTWLSFLLVPADPNFVPITALPIATDLRAQNFHLSNLAVESGAGGLALAGTGPGDAAALLPVTGASLAVPTPRGRSARLVDLAGAEVAAPAAVDGNTTRFDLSGCDYGLYAVRYADASGKPAAPPRAAVPESLYLPGAPVTLGLLDLLLARPKGVSAPAAAFPLSAGKIGPVELSISFAARETVWRYFVVPQGHSARLSDDLAISGGPTGFVRSSEQLPNGDAAELFTARDALPLRRRSEVRFRLEGNRSNGSGSRDFVTVDPLPTAPAAPVWPAPSDPLKGVSEMYVYV